MRTNNSLKNTFFSLLSNFVVMITGFIAQTFFIKYLGEEYLGINGLFNNIVSMLAVVELGIGPAIIVNLYKPLAEGNIKKIVQIMSFYKKCYYIIAIIVFILGLCILPFLSFFVNTTINFSNFGGIYLIFLFFIIDASLSYLLSYKRSIIQADQKYRYIHIIHTICYVTMNVIQIVILIFTKNYILYLIIKIIFRFLENYIVSILANKMYSYLLSENKEKLPQSEKQKIFTNVKGLIYHKIGGYIVLGTDNIIISKFLGVGLVGLYSNYYLIINSVSILISQIFNSLTSSIGNLLVTTSKEKSYEIYDKVMFLNFWIYGFASTAMYNMMTPFITFWLGDEFLLSNFVLIVLIINFYMTGMRSSIGIYKEAAGIYYEDRKIPIMESIINIIVSIILVKKLGLAGVFIGTIISSLIVVFYSLPYYVFKNVFNRKINSYYKLYFKYAVCTLLSVSLTNLVFNKLMSTCDFSIIMQVICSGILSIIISNLLFYIIFGRTNKFIYFKQIIVNILKKMLHGY